MSLNPFSLVGKRILVTGASSGIGKQVAVSCAQMGAELVITGRDAIRLEETRTALVGNGHISCIAELTNEIERNALVEHVTTKLDGVVHCAGTSRLRPIRMIDEAHINFLTSLNFHAPFLLSQRLLAKQALENESSIVFISSIAAHIGVAGVGIYSGTKAALIAAMRCLAMEVVKRKIRVNALAPALVRSPLLDATAAITGTIEEEEKNYPLGFGTTEDVANAAIFLLSPASRWITGTTLTLDGGLTVQ